MNDSFYLIYLLNFFIIFYHLLEKLQKAIPEYDWTKGHSGELLQEDVAEKLSDLFGSD